MGKSRRPGGDRTPFEQDGHLGPIPAIDAVDRDAFAMEVDDQLGPAPPVAANERLDHGDQSWMP